MIDRILSFYYSYIKKKFKYKFNRNHFNVLDVDLKINFISDVINLIFKLDKPKNQSENIAVFASILYDVGGHTACIKSLIESLNEECRFGLFLSQKSLSFQKSPTKLKSILHLCSVDGIIGDESFAKSVTELYGKIINWNPKCAFVFIHPEDIVFSTVICLIKKNTNIKIIFYNHASHYPALSFSFSDLVLEGMPVTHFVTNKFRGVDKCYVFGLQSLQKSKTKYLCKKQIESQRKTLGLKDKSLVTMTGCAPYKLFEGSNSEYFNMIKRLLIKESRLEHLVITQLNDNQRNIVENIFINSPARERLHFHDFTPNFDQIFQCCDVFIDSFPISSALTHIDLMRNKKPTIVKINKENALYSFHEYLPENYPYMFSDVSDMEEAIHILLNDKNEQFRISDILYEYFLLKYEGDVVKEKYKFVIDNLNNLDILYQDLPINSNYKFTNIS